MTFKYHIHMMLFFFFLTLSIHAQNKGEEFKKELKTVCFVCKKDSTLYSTYKNNDLHLSHYYYYYKNELDSSYIHITKALEKGKKTPKELFILYSLKGRILRDKQIYDEALQNINKAVALGKETNQKGLSELYAILGQIYIYKEQYKKAIVILEEWKTLYRHSSVDISESQIFLNLGSAYYFDENFKKAEENILRSYQINKENKDTLALVHSSTEMANVYYQQYKDSLAIPYFEEALSYAKKVNNLKALETAYKNMAVVEENRKNYKEALLYQKNYDKMKDSIWNRDKIWKMSEDEKKITAEVSYQKLEIEKAQKRRYLYFSVFLFFVVVGIGYLSFKLKQKNKIIAKQKNHLQKLNSFKNELFSILGHDLRSPIHQILTISNKLTDAVQANETKKIDLFLMHNKTAATRTYFLLDNLLYWIRLQSSHLAINKENHTLFALIHQTISNFNVIIDHKEISLKVDYDSEFSIKTDDIIFKMIFRNLLDNALKHTPKYGEIMIKCIENKYRIVVAIKDNGAGIEKEQLKAINDYHIFEEEIINTSRKRSMGFGLRLCKSFVMKLGGSLTVLSEKHKGTTTIISVLK